MAAESVGTRGACDGRLKFVDGLRGIAALMVVIYHLAPAGAVSRITARGHLGVEIFFVLSGFVIASVIGDNTITAGYFGRFVLRRCLRLDIPYWANIVLGIALGASVINSAAPASGIELIGAHLVYLQGILGFKQINDVYWTLCLEIQFYLSLLLAILIAQRLGGSARSTAFQVTVFLTLAGSLLFNAHLLPPLRGVMLGYWWNFALGAIAWWVISGRAPGWLLAVALVATFALPTEPYRDERIMGALAALALFAASVRGSMGTWLADPVTQFFGRISYSLYLFHPFTGLEVQALAQRHVGKWPAFAIGMTVSICSAWVIYRLIERPAITLSRRVRLPRAEQGAALATYAPGRAINGC